MIYRSTDLAIYLSIDLHPPGNLPIYRSTDLTIYTSIDLASDPQILRPTDPTIYISTDLAIGLSVDLQIHSFSDPPSSYLQIHKTSDPLIYQFMDLAIY